MSPPRFVAASLCFVLVFAPAAFAKQKRFSTVTTSGAEAVGTVVESGLMTCFPSGLLRPAKKKGGKRKPAYCETSAAVVDGDQLLLASDKPIPGHSPLLLLPLQSPLTSAPIRFLHQGPLPSARKIEDMTRTPKRDWFFATTAFDRVRPPPDASWDAYNMLIAWPAGHPERAQVVAADASTPPTSVKLRRRFQALLGAPFWKIEGLAALPGQRLLFGVREVGLTYKKPAYVVTLIEVTYRIQDDVVTLNDDMRLIYNLRDDQHLVQGHRVAVSSLAYLPARDRLLLLTSYEHGYTDEGLGAYLWTLSLGALHAGRPPHLVLDARGQPLHFAHKAEGLALLGDDLIAVIHDDDRVIGRRKITKPGVQFSRQPNQAAYDIVRLRWR